MSLSCLCGYTEGWILTFNIAGCTTALCVLLTGFIIVGGNPVGCKGTQSDSGVRSVNNA